MKFRARNKLELQKRALGKIRLEWKKLVLCSQTHGGDVERVRACEDVDIERTVVRIADGAGGPRPWLKASAMAEEKREEKRRARRGEEGLLIWVSTLTEIQFCSFLVTGYTGCQLKNEII